MREHVLKGAPRMSMSALNQGDDPDRHVRIWLLSAVTVKGVVYYRVAGRFMASGQTWHVNRRYSEFLMLRDTLLKYFDRAMDTCPGCLNYNHAIKQFDFPKKHLFVSKSSLVVNYRIKALRSFLNLLASWSFSNTPKCPTCGGFAFDIVRNFVVEGADAAGDANMSEIRESMVVNTFTDTGRRSSMNRRGSSVRASDVHTPQRSQALPRKDSHHRSERLRTNTMEGPAEAAAEMPYYLPASGRQEASGRGGTIAYDSPSARNRRADERMPVPAPSEANSYVSLGHDSVSGNDYVLPTRENRSENNSYFSLGNSSDHSPAVAANGPSLARYDRSENASYLSLGADSADGELPDEYHSHHPSVLPSPTHEELFAQPPPTQKYVGPSAKPPASGTARHRASAVPTVPPDSEEDSDSDEIDITGVAMAPPSLPRAKSSSGEGLWQPWELARAN